VAHLRCDGIFHDHFIANFLENIPVNEVGKLVTI